MIILNINGLNATAKRQRLSKYIKEKTQLHAVYKKQLWCREVENKRVENVIPHIFQPKAS